jgi:signal transduction histidine kinase
LAPPRSHLLVLCAVTLAAVAALAWFGWRLVQQERDVDAQRAQEGLEQAADGVVGRARAALANAAEELNRLAAGVETGDDPDEGLLLVFDRDEIVARPARRLLFHPSGDMALPQTFVELRDAERLEIREGRWKEAARAYRRAAQSPDPTLEAEALLRLGRVLRAEGDTSGARAAFERLAAIDNVRLDSGPADLVARDQARMFDNGNPATANDLRDDLLSGRWKLTQGEFEFYWARVSPAADPPRDRLLESMAAGRLWEAWKGGTAATADRVMRLDGNPLLVMQRATPTRFAARIVSPRQVLREACGDAVLHCELIDNAGVAAASGTVSGGRPVVRPASETRLPFTVRVGSGGGGAPSATADRRTLLMAQLALIAGFLIAGAYFVGRAITQAHRTAQLQAEFVSAVSHEFRSPLTSLRQLSEILAFGRAPQDDRRQKYYEALLAETGRLQRLVETLLDFGRMEAGARPYRFEPVDVRCAVLRVTMEFAELLASTGREIAVAPSAPPCRVSVDPDALNVALRNLLDNALKYSPGEPRIWIDWSATAETVVIRVRDNGLGIPAAERATIFHKFVRGRAAIARNIKGTGLGLAMVQHIVQSHGGHVEVDSQLGCGSTFSMFLPAADAS